MYKIYKNTQSDIIFIDTEGSFQPNDLQAILSGNLITIYCISKQINIIFNLSYTQILDENSVGFASAALCKAYLDSIFVLNSNTNLNTIKTSVNFGIGNYGPEFDSAVVTVTGQSWVTSTSSIQAWVSTESTLDHDPDDIWVEELMAYVGNLIPGVGFDIIVRAPNNSWGEYVVYARGL